MTTARINVVEARTDASTRDDGGACPARLDTEPGARTGTLEHHIDSGIDPVDVVGSEPDSDRKDADDEAGMTQRVRKPPGAE